MAQYNEVIDFIRKNHRNPSRHDPEERFKYCNWIKHNKKLFNSGDLKGDRIEAFKQLLAMMEDNKHINQFDLCSSLWER